MTTVFDIAEYILEQTGTISVMKLQKLVYYAQAWNLAWDEKPLFNENIEAWAYGPVVRELYDKHRGNFEISAGELEGDSDNLSKRQKSNIKEVVKFYGKKTPQWLSDLTHSERPWQEARKGLKDGERGNNVIKNSTMLAYYSSL